MSAIPPQVTQTTTPPPIIIQQLPPSPFWIGRWFVRLLMIALIFSLLYCVRLNSEYREYFQQDDGVTEQYRSGNSKRPTKSPCSKSAARSCRRSPNTS